MKRVLTVAGIIAAMTLMVSPAYADSFDLFPANDGGNCVQSVSISTVALTPEAYTMHGTGSANCPGAGTTSIEVCIQMKQPNGDFEDTGSCGAGASGGTATASADVVCVPGQVYRTRAYATQGTTFGKRKTAGVTCPQPTL